MREERLKAVPGKLPVAKIWRPESVTYEGKSFATRERSTKRGRTPRRLPAPAQTGSCSLAAAVTPSGRRCVALMALRKSTVASI